ncbi:MAG: hypothetical protein JWQ87_3897, partial [Candidatus Sulfotelmatobacter sp.]|nr:hypothetical protein [Candidatus Sulfotelmatobacter sp.]
MLALVAGILVARHLNTADDLFDSRSSPRTESLVAPSGRENHEDFGVFPKQTRSFGVTSLRTHPLCRSDAERGTIGVGRTRNPQHLRSDPLVLQQKLGDGLVLFPRFTDTIETYKRKDFTDDWAIAASHTPLFLISGCVMSCRQVGFSEVTVLRQLR